MKILILGGTSFFGLEIVKQLLGEGHKVTVFTRGRKELPDGVHDRVTHVTGDRKNRDELATAAQAGPWDAVIDNIAFTPEEVQTALELFADTGRYILTSTGSVYAWAPGSRQPQDEDSVDFENDPPDYQPGEFGWDYAYGKVYAEKALREQSAVPWTIIRPPMVLGPHDPTLRGHWYFARLMEGGPLLLSNAGANSFRLGFSEDLAAAYLLALKSERAVGGTYNVAQPEVITLREFVDAAAKVLGVQPDYVDVPARFLQRDGDDLGGPYAGMINFVPAIERAQDELGYKGTPFERWIEKTVRWFRDEFTGDTGRIMKSRAAEIEFAERWRQGTAPLVPEGQ